ncbi:MAG: hypothetical protein OQK07_01390 [Rhodospirillales bacterium]|nr:hypothetical protein [Rhodospirillales bacterium]
MSADDQGPGGKHGGKPVDDLALQVAKVESLIASARRLLAEGKMVDLSSLQGHVGELCTQIAATPDDNGRMGQTLLEIIAALDSLAKDLVEQNRKLGTAAIGASPMEATAAYKKPGGDS